MYVHQEHSLRNQLRGWDILPRDNHGLVAVTDAWLDGIKSKHLLPKESAHIKGERGGKEEMERGNPLQTNRDP